MGRELKRVALNFSWELNKVWSGYINPHAFHKCLSCDGDGWSKEYLELQNKWYGYDEVEWKQNPYNPNGRYNSLAWINNLDQDDVKALIKANRLWDFTRVPRNEEQQQIVNQRRLEGHNSWLPFDNGYIPTAKEVNEWNLKSIGHDSINCLVVIKAKLKKQGKSHLCPDCKGTGENWKSDKAKRLYNNWKNYEPPAGEGFQLWETTSEGSPKTPVFETLEALCEYCEKENVSVFGRSTATKQEWLQILDSGFVHHQEGNMIFV